MHMLCMRTATAIELLFIGKFSRFFSGAAMHTRQVSERPREIERESERKRDMKTARGEYSHATESNYILHSNFSVVESLFEFAWN